MKKLFGIILSLFLIGNFSSAQKTTFKVCDVKPSKLPILETEADKFLKDYIKRDKNFPQLDEKQKPTPKLLCSSINQDKLVQTHTHPFAQAVYLAYAEHRPLVISPDMIWLMITQGFSIHVKENAEELRHLFVDHEGQVNLDVKRGSYHPKSQNFWQGIFPDFSKAIEQNTKGELLDLVTPQFSTTTFKEKAALEITLMDAMSPFFQYSASILCGIPEITLEGTPQDWAAIAKRIEQFDTYELKWWTDDLKKIIKEFQAASEGNVNKDFWATIFDREYVRAGCGSEPYFTGWLFDFFPYLTLGGKYYVNPIVLSGSL